ncbi:hypothetical protein ABT024_14145, partial [Streptomyces sp. NPDC002812]
MSDVAWPAGGRDPWAVAPDPTAEADTRPDPFLAPGADQDLMDPYADPYPDPGAPPPGPAAAGSYEDGARYRDLVATAPGPAAAAGPYGDVDQYRDPGAPDPDAGPGPYRDPEPAVPAPRGGGRRRTAAEPGAGRRARGR